MSVAFYLQDSRFWNKYHRDHYRLGMSNGVFEILRDLLRLESPYGDNTGTINADDLLVKVEMAREEIRRHGKEWERSPEPPPEGQEDQPLKILATPGVDQDALAYGLDELYRIALYAKANGTGVKWS